MPDQPEQAMNAHAAPQEPIYKPTLSNLTRQLPEIGTGIADALAALARHPSPARARQAAIQVAGAQSFLRHLQEALVREASGSTHYGGQ